MKLITTLSIASSLFFCLAFAEETKEQNSSTNNETAYVGNGDLNGNRKHFFQKAEPEVIYYSPVSMGINNPVWGYATLDFLCWRAQRTCWYYAYDMKAFTDAIVNADILYAHPKWKPGFRLDLNFSNIYDWTIGGVFTYYHNNSIYVDDNTFLHSPIFDKYITNATTRTQSNIVFMSGDLEFGTNFNFGKTVSVKPFIGLRVAQIKDDIIFSYEGEYGSSHPIPTSLTIATYQKFTGAGPRIGIGSEYRIGRTGLDLFSLFSTSLIYGKMNVHPTYLKTTPSSVEDEQYFERFHDLKATLQLILGSQWKYYWDFDTKAFTLRFAWETNYWFDQGDYFRDREHQNQRALIFGGFNLGFGFEY